MNMVYLRLFGSTLIFLSKVLSFPAYKSYKYFTTFLLKHLVLWKYYKWYFKIVLSNFLFILVCMSLYFTVLLHSLTSSSGSFCKFNWISCADGHNIVYFFLSSLDGFIYLTYLIMLTRTCSKMFNRSDASRYSCLIPGCRVKSFSFSLPSTSALGF